jgi:hypothetical protein
MATRMQQRRGTAAQWTAANPILAAGEIGFETDTNKFKMGNGSSTWSALTYFANAAELAAVIDGAPDLLNTLNELAAAMGDDPAFITNHTTATTNVHGIANTALLSTTAGVNSAIAISAEASSQDATAKSLAAETNALAAVTTHNADQTGVHGIADTSLLALKSEIEAHNTDETNVHGIADTSLLATTANVATAKSEAIDAANNSVLTAVSSLTKSAVGLDQVDNTSDANKPVSTLQGTAISTAVSDHNADTSNVHGIADTSVLATLTDVTNAVNGAEVDQASLAGVGIDYNAVSEAFDLDETYITNATETELNLKAPKASPTFTGTVVLPAVTAGGDIIPVTDNTYDLGSPTKMWKDIYVGPGSLYVNGQKVIQDESGAIVVSADLNENLGLRTSGSGNIELDPTGTGSVNIKGPLVVEAGANFSSADGEGIAFGSGIKSDSITSKTLNTDLSLSGNGTGKVYLNDNAEVNGNLVVGGNLTVSGTTTTVNSETISLADNIIDLNSNFTSGTPTENSGIKIKRGDSADVQLRWNEGTDVWEFTNDGTTYSTIAPIASPTFTGTVNGITKTMVGLSNVDNTTDANKPVSTDTQTALDLKAPIASPTFTGTVSGVTKAMVGLGSVDNTSDAGKPVSTATQTALDAKAPIASPTFTGTVAGITKSMVGLGSVDNTADTAKPISTATQTALDAKATLASPALTGTPTAPTASAGTNTTQVATTAYVRGEVSALVASAPGALDTLNELATALGNDASFSTTMTNALAAKAPLASPTFTGTVTVAASGVAFTDGTQSKEGVPSRTPIIQKTGSYTLSALTERDSMIEVSSASAVSVTIPLNSAVAYPVGTSIDILQTSTGQVSIVGTAGVTINAAPSGGANTAKLRTQWSSCTLFKRASDTWVVYGDLTA